MKIFFNNTKFNIKKTGFTLIEIIIVVVIILIISGITNVAVHSYVEKSRQQVCSSNIQLIEKSVNIYKSEYPDWTPNMLVNKPIQEVVALGLIKEKLDNCPSNAKYYWVQRDNSFDVYCPYHTDGKIPPNGILLQKESCDSDSLVGNNIEKFKIIRIEDEIGKKLSDFNIEANFNTISLMDNEMIGISYRLNNNCNAHNITGNSFTIQKSVNKNEISYYAFYIPVKSGHLDYNNSSVVKQQIPLQLVKTIELGSFKMNLVVDGTDQSLFINGTKILNVKSNFQIDKGDIAFVSSKSTNSFTIPDVKIYDLPK